MLFLAFISVVVIDYMGIAYYYVPQLQSLRVVTIISFLLFFVVLTQGGLGRMLKFPQSKLYLLFIFLTFLALFHGFVARNASFILKVQVGYFMWMVIGVYVMSNLKMVESFLKAWVLIMVALTFINLDLILSSQRIQYFKAGYFLGDGNDFAWALNVVLPFSMYLAMKSRNFLWRLFWWGMVVCLVMGILGTQSRGATLAMAAGLGYFFFFITKKKLRLLLLACVCGLAVLPFVPSTYFGRMETLANYEEDSSAQGRLTAWKRATAMAIDNPVLGVGAGSFNSVYGRFYRQPDDPVRWISTHSIYFKVLAEYGFPGILVLLSILYFNYRTNARSNEAFMKRQEAVDGQISLPLMMNHSLVAFAVSALFLGGVDYPHIYLLTALTIAVSLIYQNESSEEDKPLARRKSFNKRNMIV